MALPVGGEAGRPAAESLGEVGHEADEVSRTAPQHRRHDLGEKIAQAGQ